MGKINIEQIKRLREDIEDELRQKSAKKVQEEIAKEAYKKQREIEQKKKIIVGVNEYKIDEKEKREVMKINP